MFAADSTRIAEPAAASRFLSWYQYLRHSPIQLSGPLTNAVADNRDPRWSFIITMLLVSSESLPGFTQLGEANSTHDNDLKDSRAGLFRRRGEHESTSGIGRSDSYIQDQNIPGINKPSTIYAIQCP